MIAICRRSRCTAVIIILTFFSSLVSPYMPLSEAQPGNLLNLPAPGTMLTQSPNFTPPLIKAITIDPNNALKFDFIIDAGDSTISDEEFNLEADKLAKYFMAALTVPSEELWVNLSPYEEDRIIPRKLGYTEMGRDLLAQDYVLKQLTASLMFPEESVGKEFWQRVQDRANELFGSKDIPMNTFNKIWIIPDEAMILERDNNAIVVNSHLKVMLEEDYLALKENLDSPKFGTDKIKEDEAMAINTVTSDVVREVLLPEIEREVNEGKNFANLRQIYNAMILATWYKLNLKESLLSRIYVDKNRIDGIDVEDREIKDKIFDQYLQAFQKGAYDYTKKEIDLDTFSVVPKRYYSGGFAGEKIPNVVTRDRISRDTPIPSLPAQTREFIDNAMQSEGNIKRFTYSLDKQPVQMSTDRDVTLPRLVSVVQNNPNEYRSEADRIMSAKGITEPAQRRAVTTAIEVAALRSPDVLEMPDREIISFLRENGVNDQTAGIIERENLLPQIAVTSFERSTFSPDLAELHRSSRATPEKTQAALAKVLTAQGRNQERAGKIASTAVQVATESPEAATSPVKFEQAMIERGMDREDARLVSDRAVINQVAAETQDQSRVAENISSLADTIASSTNLGRTRAETGARAFENIVRRDPSMIQASPEQMRSAMATEIGASNNGQAIAAAITQDNNVFQEVKNIVQDRRTIDNTVSSIPLRVAADRETFEIDYRESFRPDLSQADRDLVVNDVISLAIESPQSLSSPKVMADALVSKGRSPALVQEAVDSLRQLSAVTQFRDNSNSLLPLVSTRRETQPEKFDTVVNALLENDGITPTAPIAQAMREVPMAALNSGERGVLDWISRSNNQDVSRSVPTLRERRFIPKLAHVMRDRDMAIKDTGTRGGIDLNMAMLELSVQQEGMGVQMAIAPESLDTLNLGGFEPILTGVSNISNLERELGLDNL